MYVTSLPGNPAIVEPLLRGQAFYEVDSETDAKFSGLLRLRRRRAHNLVKTYDCTDGLARR
jgi:hypothetical protein